MEKDIDEAHVMVQDLKLEAASTRGQQFRMSGGISFLTSIIVNLAKFLFTAHGAK